jgi:ribosomal-protein-alanine N-acetyltransferase
MITLISDSAMIKTCLDPICTIETATFDPPWKKEDFAAELECRDSVVVVLLENNRLLGYLFAKKVLDEVQINKVCIHPDFRGRGYGKKLFGGFVSRMKAAGMKLFLEVDSTNIAAVKLYKRFGFTTTRIRKKIYANGADAFEMACGGE